MIKMILCVVIGLCFVTNIIITVYQSRKLYDLLERLRIQEASLIALFMLLRNARLQQSGVWFVTRDDLNQFEYGWVLEHFLDGRQNWQTYLERCVKDPEGFAAEHAKLKHAEYEWRVSQETGSGSHSS